MIISSNVLITIISIASKALMHKGLRIMIFMLFTINATIILVLIALINNMKK